MVQYQTLNPPGDDNIFYPAINVDIKNNMSIAFSIGGRNRYISIGITARLCQDPLGTTRDIFIVKQGKVVYEPPYDMSPARWGDYSALTLDPVDNLTFWLYNEYPTLVTIKPPITRVPSVISSWSTFACSYILNNFMSCMKSNVCINQNNESINHPLPIPDKNNLDVVENVNNQTTKNFTNYLYNKQK